MEVAKTKQPSKYLCAPQYRRSQLVVKGVKYKQENYGTMIRWYKIL